MCYTTSKQGVLQDCIKFSLFSSNQIRQLEKAELITSIKNDKIN